MDKKDPDAKNATAEIERLAALFLRQAGRYVLSLLDVSGRVLSYNEEGERIECWPLDHVLGKQHDLSIRPTRSPPADHGPIWQRR